MRRIVTGIALAGLLAAGAFAYAEDPKDAGVKVAKPTAAQPMKAAAAAAEPAKAAAASTAPEGVRGEAWRNLDDPAGKLLQLAEAIPADKYAWRPAEGVRSVSEAFLHVAAGNFNIPRRLGAVVPEGIDFRTLEKSTSDKAKVIEMLASSIAAARGAIEKLPDSELEKTSKWFDGRMITNREVAFFVGGHNHEHLGQMIAYARMNGVTPPWSAAGN
jgi:uncharacterized damage-inducible protein DinB